MEYHVELSHRALRDLAKIYDFVHAYDSEAGLSWFNELEEGIFGLGRYPERGVRAGKNNRRRILFFGSKPTIYKIIYEVDRKNRLVKIFHVRHGARA